MDNRPSSGNLAKVALAGEIRYTKRRFAFLGFARMSVPVVQVLRLHPAVDADLPLPRYMTAGAAGADVVAALEHSVELAPMQRAAIPTGIALQVPVGWEIQVRPRSGLALRHGLTVLNAPGTIDSDYRGEVMILLVNLGCEVVVVARGDRIAQLVLAAAPQAEFAEQIALAGSDRGSGGFGSTGAS